MAEYTQGIIIDGVHYDIPLAKLDLTFDFLEKYANRTEDGDIKIETIGGYQNYTVEVGTIDNPNLYKQLYDHITDVRNRFHTVVLPDIQSPFTFYGYFSSIKASVDKVMKNKVRYKGLTWKMTEKNTTRS